MNRFARWQIVVLTSLAMSAVGCARVHPYATTVPTNSQSTAAAATSQPAVAPTAAVSPAASVRPTPAGPTPSAAATLSAVPTAKPATAPKYNKYKGPNTTSRVLFTFDDCPKASVGAFKATIDYMARVDFGSILLFTGQCVASFKKRGFDIVKYNQEHGIWASNHSYSHPQLNRLSKVKIKSELTRGVVSNYGRPPYGAANKTVQSVYASLGMRIVLWDVDTEDWKGKSSKQIVAHIKKYTRKGSNVLMHMQHRAFNPDTIKSLIKTMKAKGLKICGVWRGSDFEGPIVKTGAKMPANICKP